jgi:DNA-directed RNA polymerase subunit L
MELKVVENKKNRLVIELSGTDHTFCNALKKELWNDKSVKVSAYNIEHPLIGIPRIILETEDKEPKKVLSDAIKRLDKKNEQFLDSFKKIKL